MTDDKITEEAVIVALDAYWRKPASSPNNPHEWTEDARNSMREALRASLSEAMVARRYILPWAAGCVTCSQHMPGETIPPHDASPRCESGKRSHCSCDLCF